MPFEFEVAANNCEFAAQVLDAGIEAYVTARDLATEITYICVENGPAVSAWQVFLYIYLVVLIISLAGWVVYYRRGASSDKLLKWGIVSFALPPLAPIVAIFNFGDGQEISRSKGAKSTWDEKGDKGAYD